MTLTMRFVIIGFDEAYELLKDYKVSRVSTHRPDYIAVLQLLVRCYLCRSRLEIDPRDLLLSVLSDNYMEEFTHDATAEHIYNIIKYRVGLALPNFDPHILHHQIDYDQLDFTRTTTAVICLDDEAYERIAQI